MHRPHTRLPNGRRYFRDRVLLAMLAVALVPLLTYAALVAGDLRSVGRDTVAETRLTILRDAQARESQQVTDRAAAIDVQLGGLLGQVRAAAQQAAQAAPEAPGSGTRPLTGRTPLAYVQDGRTTILVGSRSRLLQGGAVARGGADAAVLDPDPGLLQTLAAIHDEHPDLVESVWVADPDDLTVRTMPGLVEPASLDRADPRQLLETPLLQPGDATAAAGERRPGRAPSDESPQPSPQWSDPHPVWQTGDTGVGLWVRAGGTGTPVVGVDLNLLAITGLMQAPPVSTDVGAYAVLLSDSGLLLGTGDGASRDLGLPDGSVGLPLNTVQGSRLSGVMLAAARSGGPASVHATLSRETKLISAAPVHSAPWTIATVVPVRDLEPDMPALAHGLDAGVGRVFWQVLPVGLALCIVALLLATFFARRLVGPVGALMHSAERLAAGHTEEPVPPQGDDEVGMLAHSLERMRREVNASRDAILAAARELEGRVAARTSELRTRNEELVALNALAARLTRSLEPGALLDGALQALSAMVPVRAAAGWVLEGDVLRRVAERGVGEEVAPLGDSARAALSGERLVTMSAAEGTMVGMVLRTSDGPCGALAAMTPPGTVLEERTRALLGAVADQVGLALRTARLSEEGRSLAVMAERARLAREIHDTIAQQLTAIVIQLEAAEAFLERDASRARTVVTSARDQARSALQEARRSVWDLRPQSLEATGLVAALAAEARRWQERTGIPAKVRTRGVRLPLPLQPQAEVALFRIVQEALSNVEHHSGASRVDVRVEQRGGRLDVSVVDDGCGFEPAGQPADRFGLVGMAERARLVGAQLDVQSRRGGGARVTARLQLGQAEAVA